MLGMHCILGILIFSFLKLNHMGMMRMLLLVLLELVRR